MIKDINNSIDEFMDNDLFILDFYASWCRPCKVVGESLKKLSDEHENVIVGKCDIEENDELIEKFSIKNVPTVIIYHKGKEVDKFVGSKSYEQILSKVESYL